MDFQSLIVAAIIFAAVAFAAISLLRKRRAFSVKHGCSHDCGCNDSKP
jgi:hypothetical protein